MQGPSIPGAASAPSSSTELARAGAVARVTAAWRALLTVGVVLALLGCGSLYYQTMERLGFEKREILVDRVRDARGEQEEAREVFTSALDEFRSMVDVQGGELEERYDQLQTSYERSRDQAQQVRSRIEAVGDVAGRLFEEWEDELASYESAELRGRSERQLRETEQRYEDLMAAMQRAAERMDPVLELYEDQVLFLKHNLNARAIASLDVERAEIEDRVDALLDDMNAAIAEADAFITAMS